MSQDRGALPKFGEWDVNNPASAEGFTVIFNKARDEKKAPGGGAAAVTAPPTNNNPAGYRPDASHDPPRKTKLFFCCG